MGNRTGIWLGFIAAFATGFTIHPVLWLAMDQLHTAQTLQQVVLEHDRAWRTEQDLLHAEVKEAAQQLHEFQEMFATWQQALPPDVRWRLWVTKALHDVGSTIPPP